LYGSAAFRNGFCVKAAPRTPQEEIAALRQQLAERDAVIAERDAGLAEAAAEIEHLKFQLAALRRRHFGQSSEKLAAEIAQLELRLEDLEENQAEREAKARAPSAGAAAKPEAKPRKPGARKPLPAHLPREVVVHEPEVACQCNGRDSSRLTKIGENVTEVLERIPVRFKVIRHVRPKYACRVCEQVFQAPVPELPIEKGKPGPGLIAHVAVSKYADGLPLHRQSAMFAREGVEIERMVMADWIGHAAWWLAPLAQRIGQHVMAQPAIHSDDTTIRTLAPGLGRTRIARFWCYAVDPRNYAGDAPPAAFYRYSPDRKGERPQDHLAGFRGFLHADAFAGYNALYHAKPGEQPRITHVACRVGGDVSAPTPHRPGRADFPHPVLHGRASLGTAYWRMIRAGGRGWRFNSSRRRSHRKFPCRPLRDSHFFHIRST
jgi:transposase